MLWKFVFVCVCSFWKINSFCHACIKAKLNKWEKVELIKIIKCDKRRKTAFYSAAFHNALFVSYAQFVREFAVVNCVHNSKSREFLFLDDKKRHRRREFCFGERHLRRKESILIKLNNVMSCDREEAREIEAWKFREIKWQHHKLKKRWEGLKRYNRRFKEIDNKIL